MTELTQQRPVTSAPVPQQMPPVIAPVPAPQVPAGWVAAAPDFVGVGTMRSGTSWWWRMLTEHPRFMQAHRYKEIHFFDHYAGVRPVDPAAYHQYFPRQKGGFTGEWTPRYMYDYWVPPMLRQVAPETRILVMLRDPVQRYLSGLAYTQARGFASSPALIHHQFERSLYGQQLAALLGYFPAEQVLVLQYEQCVAEPVRFIRQTLEFIGVDSPQWQPSQDAQMRVNATRADKPDLTAADREALALALRADLTLVFGLFPTLDPALWPTCENAAMS